VTSFLDDHFNEDNTNNIDFVTLVEELHQRKEKQTFFGGKTP